MVIHRNARGHLSYAITSYLQKKKEFKNKNRVEESRMVGYKNNTLLFNHQANFFFKSTTKPI